MVKASIELFRIHKSFKVKFGLILKEDESNPNNKNFQLINKFSFKGNDYIRISPYPFITIDIMGRLEKYEEWNANFSVTMNRKDLFMLILSLKGIYKKFSEDKDLFYYNEQNELVVNGVRADNAKVVISVGNKTLWFQPCVVTNEEDKVSYEGLFMVINSPDYYTYLTYVELEYLIYELSHIDMNSLSLLLIDVCSKPEIMNSVTTQELPGRVTVETVDDTSRENTPTLKRHVQESTIPEI